MTSSSAPQQTMNKKNPLKSADFRGFLVRVTRFERAISTSQMWRGTNSATPGYSVFAIITRHRRKSKIFLSVVIPVVRAACRSCFAIRRNPANASAARLSGLRLLRSWMKSKALPKQARYQLRYTRLWNCFICGLSCGLGRFLTNGFAEMVPAYGSVPASCGVAVLSSWMGGICSQTKRAPNLYYTQLY